MHPHGNPLDNPVVAMYYCLACVVLIGIIALILRFKSNYQAVRRAERITRSAARKRKKK